MVALPTTPDPSAEGSAAARSSHLVYLSSRFGDSQLVRLEDVAPAGSPDLQLVASYSSLAPIIDCCLVKDETGSSVRPVLVLSRNALAELTPRPRRTASWRAPERTRRDPFESCAAESACPSWRRSNFLVCKSCGAFPVPMGALSRGARALLSARARG